MMHDKHLSEEIDLTLRREFSLVKFDKFDTERQYLEKYGVQDIMQADKRSDHIAMLLDSIKLSKWQGTLFEKDEQEDSNKKWDWYDFYQKIFGSIPPWAMKDYQNVTYGYYSDGSHCDCCGIPLDFFNSTKYAICQQCDENMEYDRYIRIFFGEAEW